MIGPVIAFQKEDILLLLRAPVRHFAAFVVMALACLFGRIPAFAQQAPEQEVLKIVAQSQEALNQHDEQKALTLIRDGLARFPEDEDLIIQWARIYVAQKKDREAIGLLNSVLLKNPDSRNAKLALAQVFGYRQNYRESDRLYHELLTANADDEAAALGLVHNLILEGKREEARQQLQQAVAKHPSSLELQQYGDYLAETAGHEAPPSKAHRIQNSESFFSDTSGNRSVYSAQGMTYQITNKLTTRVRLTETSLWKTGTITETLLDGTAEGHYRLNKYVAIRSSVGAVRFADESSRVLYGGDLFRATQGLLQGGQTGRSDPAGAAGLHDLPDASARRSDPGSATG